MSFKCNSDIIYVWSVMLNNQTRLNDVSDLYDTHGPRYIITAF